MAGDPAFSRNPRPTPPRRPPARAIFLDRALEALPLFRLSDSAEETTILFTPPAGGRWRVLPAPGDRLPGTFDQDVYVEICRRYQDSGTPDDGTVSFTLHAFLRSIGRRADGRTYEQLRAALNRLERTALESSGAYWNAATGEPLEGRFTVLSAVSIDRRRTADREQLALFPTFTASEPGDARVILSPLVRANIARGHSTTLSPQLYQGLSSPVARRLYRLLEVARADDTVTWRIELEALAEQVPLVQRYPSHLQRVLQPAHEMLQTAGIVRDARVHQIRKQWYVDYVLATRPT
jgi:plasmid replication initiation protein